MVVVVDLSGLRCVGYVQVWVGGNVGYADEVVCWAYWGMREMCGWGNVDGVVIWVVW